MPLSNTVAGILFALGGTLAFTLNDAIIKFLSGDYPLHEVILIRSGIALVLTFAVLMPMEGGFHNIRTRRYGAHLFRGLLVVITNSAFFLGLAAVPLGEATAVFFVAPLVITIFSVIFLGEHVGAWRWTAVIVGLVGAIIMLRPGSSSFQMAALLPLAAAFGYAGMQTMTRKLGVTERASTLAFYIQLTFIVVSAAIGLVAGDSRFAGSGGPSVQFLLRAWVMPSASDWLVLVGLGLVSSSGGYFMARAYRQSQAAVLAPFEYAGLVLAIILGILMFGEWPDLVAWTGIALILGAGLFVFWRETVRGREIAAKRPMPRHR